MKKELIWIFFSALIVRLVYVGLVYFFKPEGVFVFDSWGYLNLGSNLYHHQVFSQYTDGSFIPDSTRTPIYPLFISLFHLLGINEWGIILSQALASSGIVLSSVIIAKKLGLNKKGLVALSIILIADPVSIFFQSVILSETIFCLALSLAVLMYLNRAYAATGIILGLSILIKPIAFALLLVFLLHLISNRKTTEMPYKKLVYLVLPVLLLSFSWQIRNKLAFDEFFISSIAEVNFLFHTATNIKAKAESLDAKEVEKSYRKDLLGDLDFNKTESIKAFRSRSKRELKHQISQHPIEFLKISSKSFFLFFIKPLRSYFDEQFGIKEAVPLFGVNNNGIGLRDIFKESSALSLSMIVIQGLMLLMILFGFIQQVKSGSVIDKPYYVLLVLLILYFAFASSITEVDARFKLPVFPFIAILGLSSKALNGKQLPSERS